LPAPGKPDPAQVDLKRLAELMAQVETELRRGRPRRALNPGYPGDYVKHPKLPWFQPTFPKAGTRYKMKPDEPLLRYRLWIVDGPAPDAATCLERFRGYQSHLMSKDR
jgi:hypothetical protein